MITPSIGLTVACALVAGMLSQWAAWYLRKPAILILLITGLVAGMAVGSPSQLGIPDAVLFQLVSLGVAVILFEGSLTLRFSELKGISRAVRNLIIVGVTVTCLGMGAAAHLIAGAPISVALLFGAIVSVTGPTVIVPLLRTLQPTRRIASILRWEGIVIDPVGAILAVLVYTAVVSESAGSSVLKALMLTVACGAGLGAAGAFALGEIIKRHWIPEYLVNFAVLSVVIFVFQVSNAIEHESGLLAVTVMGIAMANMRDVNTQEILHFKEHLSVVLISLMFILLSSRMEMADIQAIGWSGLVLVLVAQFVIRPLAVLLSSPGTSMSLKEGALLAWIAPRGIVAAAVSAVFALGLEERGIEGAQFLAPAVFVMIVGTVLFQSLTARPLAVQLGLADSNPQGVLIVGANPVALEIALALKRNGIRTLIASDNWDGINEARLAGIDCYYGSPLSEHADLHLDLSGLTKLLIVSGRSELSALVFAHFRSQFGHENIYALASKKGQSEHSKRRLALPLRSRNLFGGSVSWKKLATELKKGGAVRTTKLTDTFSVDDYHAEHGKNAIELFVLDKNKQLHVVTENFDYPDEDNWAIVALFLAKEAE